MMKKEIASHTEENFGGQKIYCVVRDVKQRQVLGNSELISSSIHAWDESWPDVIYKQISFFLLKAHHQNQQQQQHNTWRFI